MNTLACRLATINSLVVRLRALSCAYPRPRLKVRGSLRAGIRFPGHRQQRTVARQFAMADHGGLQREQSIQHDVHQRRRLDLPPGRLAEHRLAHGTPTDRTIMDGDNASFYKGRRVLITGGLGFIGSKS